MELKTLSDIRPLERYRVEDVSQYADAELGVLLKGIFGLADIPGTIKKLKAKELYLLADGVAKKPLANLPVLAPVIAAPIAGGKTGAATGAVAAPKEDGNAGLTDKEIIDLNRRLDEAEKNGPERFGEGEEKVDDEPSDVFHTVTNPKAGQGVVNGIDPAYLNPNSRFGKAFYVSDDASTTLAELNHHGATGSHTIRMCLDPSKARILDLTDPSVAGKWGYIGGPITPQTQAIGAVAKANGHNTIKFQSLRGPGANYAVVDDFNSVLTPKMIVPSS